MFLFLVRSHVHIARRQAILETALFQYIKIVIIALHLSAQNENHPGSPGLSKLGSSGNGFGTRPVHTAFPQLEFFSFPTCHRCPRGMENFVELVPGSWSEHPPATG